MFGNPDDSFPPIITLPPVPSDLNCPIHHPRPPPTPQKLDRDFPSTSATNTFSLREMALLSRNMINVSWPFPPCLLQRQRSRLLQTLREINYKGNHKTYIPQFVMIDLRHVPLGRAKMLSNEDSILECTWVEFLEEVCSG